MNKAIIKCPYAGSCVESSLWIWVSSEEHVNLNCMVICAYFYSKLLDCFPECLWHHVFPPAENKYFCSPSLPSFGIVSVVDYDHLNRFKKIDAFSLRQFHDSTMRNGIFYYLKTWSGIMCLWILIISCYICSLIGKQNILLQKMSQEETKW